MDSRLVRKCFKQLVAEAKRINKNISDLSYNTDRYRIRIAKLRVFKYHIKPIYIFEDRLMPENSMYVIGSLEIYEHDIIDNDRYFNYSNGKALNSWIQYCEHGEILDSPPGVHVPSYDKKDDKLIEKMPFSRLTETDKEYIENAIPNIAFSNSAAIYGNKNKNRIDGYSRHYTFELNYYRYKQIVFVDNSNSFMLAIINFRNRMLITIPYTDRRVLTTKLITKEELDELDPTGAIKCFMALNK